MRIKRNGSLIPIVFGTALMLCFLAELVICKRSFEYLYVIRGKIILPPIWIFSSLYILALFLLGVGAGLFYKEIFDGVASIQTENTILKGAVFCIPSVFLMLLWYPALFNIQMPLLSLIFAFFSVLLIIIASTFWSQVSVLNSMFVFPYALWMVYLFMTNLVLIFKI